jgi:hypothetical protein
LLPTFGDESVEKRFLPYMSSSFWIQ